MKKLLDKILYFGNCHMCKKKLNRFAKNNVLENKNLCEQCYTIKIIKNLEKEKKDKQKKLQKLEKVNDFKLYTNKDYGFRLKVPKNWKEEQGQTTVAKFSSKDGLSKITLKIRDCDFTQTDLNKKMEDYIKKIKDEFESEFEREITLIENENENVFENIYQDFIGPDEFKWSSVTIIKNGKQYELNFITKPEQYEKLIKKKEVCINSFKFI